MPDETAAPSGFRYVSVCSGVEAAGVAWSGLGWTPEILSEIEAFPRRVLSAHYPDVELRGDFTELLDDPPTANLLVGGTPCQSFSVAGARAGLADPRGNLTSAFAELADAIRSPRAGTTGVDWTLWENVPGVLSDRSNGFGCLLGHLCGAEKPLRTPDGKSWPVCGVVAGQKRVAAWRVLDARHFGVPQRRRRVFLLARRLGADGPRPDEILFDV